MVDIIGGAKELYDDITSTASNLGSMAFFDNDENVTFEGRRDALKLGGAALGTATGGALVDEYVEKTWNEATPNVYIGDRPRQDGSEGGDSTTGTTTSGGQNDGSNDYDDGSTTTTTATEDLTLEEQVNRELTENQRETTWDYLSDQDFENSQETGDLTVSEAPYNDDAVGDNWAESNWDAIVDLYNEHPDLYSPSE